MTNLGYDGRDRLTSQQLPDGQAVTLGYDGAGNLTFKSLRAANGVSNTVRYTYDAANRLNRVTEPDGKVVRFSSYDASNRPWTVTYPDGGMTLTRIWDGFGRLQRMRAVPVSATAPLVDLQYQYAFSPPDGTSPIESTRVHTTIGTDGVSTQFTYDGIGQLLSATNGTAGGRYWTYDANRNRSSQRVGASGRTVVTHYNYDAGDQLLSTSQPSGRADALHL